MNAEARAQNIESGVLLASVLHKIDTLLGLRYQPHQWSDLLRLLKPAARELGFTDSSIFLTWLANSDQDENMIRVLAKHLTIGESYFFREIVVFSILREQLLPALLERKQAQGDRHVRIWSAGCSTGEEVYTLAILLDSFLEGRQEWKYSVLGTDVNPVAIERARDAKYRDWSFRDVPAEIHSSYFEQTEDGRHSVISRIKDRTEFKMLNLVSAPALYPAGFDLVFCRNVLMYFTRDKVKSIIQGFRRSLTEGGWLVPSLTETTLVNNPGFEGVRFGDATLFRKQPHVTNILTFRGDKDNAADDDAERAVLPASTGMRNPFAGLFSTREKQDEPQELSESLPATASDNPIAPVSIQDAEESPVNAALHDAADNQLPENVHQRILEARQHADAGRLDDALAVTQTAISLNKMDPHAHFMHGTILRESGETSQALQAFERALYLNQDFIPAHFSIATLHHQLGNQAKARRHFGIALHLIEAQGDLNLILEPGEISAQRMVEIIRTFIER
ncbi:MAG: hypothetical protein IH600_12140 [Bacteroidetes bacterium]|nr:hypothetical protein [Bacteroidota bacterium]